MEEQMFFASLDAATLYRDAAWAVGIHAIIERDAEGTGWVVVTSTSPINR